MESIQGFYYSTNVQFSPFFLVIAFISLDCFAKDHLKSWFCKSIGKPFWEFIYISLASTDQLCVYYCDSIVNVDMLCNVQDLRLCCCKGIRDISKLGTCQSLLLNSLESASGFASLGSVKCLRLWHIHNLTDHDLLSLRNLPSLELFWCYGIINVDCLSSVENLELRGMINVIDVSALSTIPKLTITRCRKISNWGTLLGPDDIFSDFTCKYEYGRRVEYRVNKKILTDEVVWVNRRVYRKKI